MALHPHSGIATLTYMIEGSVRYEDTSGANGILPEGGVEWFKAGHGAWHGGGPNGSGPNPPLYCSANMAGCRARFGRRPQ